MRLLLHKKTCHLNLNSKNESLSQFKIVTVTLSHIKIDCQRNNLVMFDSKRETYDFCHGPDGNVFTTKNPGRITMQKTKSCSFCASPMSFTFTITLTNSGTVKQTTATSTKPISSSTTTMLNTTTITASTIAVKTTLPMFPVECGSPAIAPLPTGLRIVGGISSRGNSWPWQVLLDGIGGRCAGSLINDQVKKIFS